MVFSDVRQSPALIDFAAGITAATEADSSQVFVGILLMTRGQQQILNLQVQVAANYGSELYVWEHGGYKDGEWLPREWTGPIDPWESCNFLGELFSGTSSAGSFCGSCGIKRSSADRFCAACGKPFQLDGFSTADLRSTLENERKSSARIPETVVALIDAHALKGWTAQDRDLLLTKLRQILVHAKVTTFIDGQSKRGKSRLTLANAQALRARLQDSDQLDLSADLEVAKLVLTKGPLEFGYWSTFKTLLKFASPTPFAHEFGIALARLTMAERNRGKQSSGTSDDVEDISLVSGMFQIPNVRTLSYLTRRVRRQLSQIAQTDPASYATLAMALLQEFDRPFGPTDHIPAFVIAGRQSYLDIHGRTVELPLNQSVPTHPFQEIWSRHATEVRSLLLRVEKSPEILTFAIHVLRDAGLDIPVLSTAQIPLAIRSSDQSIRAIGIEQLVITPDSWELLSSSDWVTVFHQTSLVQFDLVVNGLLHRKRISHAAVASSEMLLNSRDTDRHRSGELARIYLAYSMPSHDSQYRNWPYSKEADTAAIIAIAHKYGFETTPESWISLLKCVPWTAVLQAIVVLANEPSVSQQSLDVLADLLVASDLSPRHVAVTCFESASDRLNPLAWRLLSLEADRSATAVYLWNWLKQSELGRLRSLDILSQLMAQEWNGLASELAKFLLADPLPHLTTDDLAAVLRDIPSAPSYIWTALSRETAGFVLSLVLQHKDLLRSVGDQIDEANLSDLTTLQVRVFLAYLKLREDRIQTDASFGAHVACLPIPSLQEEALAQLVRHQSVGSVWLVLAESRLPQPLQVARTYLEKVREPQASAAILAAIDSQVEEVRDLGLEIFHARRNDLNSQSIWEALLESDDPIVQSRVAEEALTGRFGDLKALSTFDRRMLITRRKNRRAKEQIKSRLENELSDFASLVAPSRIEALTELASSSNRRDREWALQRLAALHFAGVSVTGVDIRTTSEGSF